MLPSSVGGGGVDGVGVLVGFSTRVFDGVGVRVAPALVGSSVGVTVGSSVGTPVGPAVGRCVGVFPGVGRWVGVPVVSFGVGVWEGEGTGELVAATGSLDVVT
jgi:hypothetical protein